MNDSRLRLQASLLIVSALALSACVSTPTNKQEQQRGNSLELFPQQDIENRVFSISEFVLTLPKYELGEISDRSRFAQWMFEEGSPQPIAEQKRYLFLPPTGLDSGRHFLLLDQRHLLIYHEYMDLEDGYPAYLKILRREQDISWRDVTSTSAPAWTHSPQEVEFLNPESAQPTIRIQGVFSGELKAETFHWKDGNLQALPAE